MLSHGTTSLDAPDQHSKPCLPTPGFVAIWAANHRVGSWEGVVVVVVVVVCVKDVCVKE